MLNLTSDEKLESVKLAMALKFLKSTVMKKRLAGINEIKSIIEMTADSSRQNWPYEYSPRKSKWLKPDYLCRWIYDNKLVEYLLSDSSHVELIKRSGSILRFLSSNKQLTKDHLELLWKWQDGKHEANVLGVFETIIEIWADLSVESLDFIFSKIVLIPTKKYNEHTLNFLKDFTTNALQVYKNSERTELIEISSDDEDNKQQEIYLENAKSYVDGNEIDGANQMQDYGLSIIYEIAQQNGPLNAPALKALLELLKHRWCESFRMRYILNCIRNLRNGVAAYQSIATIISILPRWYSTK